MNYIGIDISINSTAIYIESNLGKFILSYTNKKANNIYIKNLSAYGVMFCHHTRDVSKDYSKNEILKLNHYIKISNSIIEEIIKRLDLNEKTFCQIEGYSFSKKTSSILDIVSLSTLIRVSLINSIKNIDITIISPSTLKLETCKLVYPPINIGKRKPKYVYKNNEGIAGGSFKKPEMFRAMLEGNIDSPLIVFLQDNRDLILKDKIPNPIEDIIDAIWCCKILSK